MINFRFRVFQVMNLYNKVFIIFFLCIIPTFNAIEKHLCDIAAFMIFENVFLTRF